MSRKFKVITAVLVAVILLSTLGIASVAMADEPEDATSSLPPGVQSLLARVAGILGITEDELTGAFRQAREEMREECQASNNCTATDRAFCQNRINRFCDRIEERQERWAERGQQWQENKERLMDRWQHRWSQDDDTAAQGGVNLQSTVSGIVASDTVY